MTTDLAFIPARILLQVREGNLNLLSDFEVKVASSVTRDDGVIEHDTSVSSIITGLAKAMQSQVQLMREGTDDLAGADEWLGKIRDWIFDADDSEETAA